MRHISRQLEENKKLLHVCKTENSKIRHITIEITDDASVELYIDKKTNGISAYFTVRGSSRIVCKTNTPDIVEQQVVRWLSDSCLSRPLTFTQQQIGAFSSTYQQLAEHDFATAA